MKNIVVILSVIYSFFVSSQSTNIIKNYTWEEAQKVSKDSVFSITKEYGYNSGNIYNCCRGVVLSVNGYIWRYKDDFLEIDLNKFEWYKRQEFLEDFYESCGNMR